MNRFDHGEDSAALPGRACTFPCHYLRPCVPAPNGSRNASHDRPRLKVEARHRHHRHSRVSGAPVYFFSLYPTAPSEASCQPGISLAFSAGFPADSVFIREENSYENFSKSFRPRPSTKSEWAITSKNSGKIHRVYRHFL